MATTPDVERVLTGALSNGKVAEFRISDHDTQPESCGVSGVSGGAIEHNRPAEYRPPRDTSDMLWDVQGQTY